MDTDTRCTTEFNKQLYFTTYVVIDMKSPHLLSTVHDLAILHTICSVVTKRKDFITTRIVVSQYSADSFMIAFPTNHAMMPHFDNNSLLVSRALVVHPPRRRNQQTPSMHPWFLSHHRRHSRSHYRNSRILCLPGRVLILAQETLFYKIANGVLSRTRLHDRFCGDPLYTTIALQPIVSAATTIRHTDTQSPYQKDHSCVIQCCRARLHVVTLCASC